MLSATAGIGLALLSLIGGFVYPEATCPGRFLGVWEYRQRAGAGYDTEGERIELSCRDGSMLGLYYGLEREGEHGLFYTLVELADLELDSNGHLAFTVPGRELFHERPRHLQEVAQKKLASAGFTRDQLRMVGRLQAESLVLSCTSTGYSCPEKVMVFHKGR